MVCDLAASVQGLPDLLWDARMVKLVRPDMPLDSLVIIAWSESHITSELKTPIYFSGDSADKLLCMSLVCSILHWDEHSAGNARTSTLLLCVPDQLGIA